MLDALKGSGFEILFESHAIAILDRDFPTALADIEQVLSTFEIPITEMIGSGGGETLGTQRLRRALNAKGWHKTNFEIKKAITISAADPGQEIVSLEHQSTSHEIDHVKAFDGEFAGNKLIALEIEWNNKDPFFDRDLENFKRLHAEGAISVGVIVTRGSTLHERTWEFVKRYADETGIDSFADLDRLGISITAKQKLAIVKRTNRARKPVPFREAWVDKFVGDKYGEATTHWSKLMARVSRGVGNPCPLLLIGLPAQIVRFDVDVHVQEVEEEHSGATEI
jgi:hypothetical protein